MNRYVSCGILLGGMCLALGGCGTRQAPSAATHPAAAKDRLTTVRLHFEGFTKSKSGAT